MEMVVYTQIVESCHVLLVTVSLPVFKVFRNGSDVAVISNPLNSDRIKFHASHSFYPDSCEGYGEVCLIKRKDFDPGSD
jgi:hypothetical protein